MKTKHKVATPGVPEPADTPTWRRIDGEDEAG
jgi:hypothetical protein